jgi:dienelactone hydrolase
MRRDTVAIFALALAVLVAGVIPLRSGAQEATPATPLATTPQPPLQPTTGPGSSEAFFRGVTAIKQAPPGRFLADYWLFVPADPRPGTTLAGEPFPLVIFIPGSGAVDADLYLAWVEHLVRRGAVVLYPLYQVAIPGGETGDRQNVLDDVRAGLETLEREGIAVDVSGVAVVGHSLGAEQAVIYTASAAGAGLPVVTAVMSIAPECQSAEGACLGMDLGAVPADARVLLVTEAEDPLATSAVKRIWAELEAVPWANREVVTLPSDAHGRPVLAATHTQALASDGSYPPDVLDWYGTWKWLDALMGCAFEGKWCEYALGDTPEQRFMGVWSDGVPVAGAIITDDPT